MFYAYTGCDTVSSFATRVARQTWNTFDDVTEMFCILCHAPGEIGDEAMVMLEHFTVLLYDSTSDMD